MTISDPDGLRLCVLFIPSGRGESGLKIGHRSAEGKTLDHTAIGYRREAAHDCKE
jgi:hypothetical protein